MTVPNVTKKKEGKKEVNWPRGCYSFSSSFFSFSLTKTKLTKTLLKFFSSGKPGDALMADLLNGLYVMVDRQNGENQECATAFN